MQSFAKLLWCDIAIVLFRVQYHTLMERLSRPGWLTYSGRFTNIYCLQPTLQTDDRR